MAQSLPCPNPICTHSFDLAQVQASANLRCPRCGFQLKGQAAPVAPPQAKAPPKPAPLKGPVVKMTPAVTAKPSHRPAPPAEAPVAPQAKVVVSRPAPLASSPVARPVTAAPPAFSPNDYDVELVEDPAAATLPPGAVSARPVNAGPAFPLTSRPGGPLVQARHVPRGSLKKKLIMLAVLLVGTGALVGGGYYLYRTHGRDGEGGLFSQGPRSSAVVGAIRNSKNVEEKIFRLVLPEWADDKQVRTDLATRRDGGNEPWFAKAWKHPELDLWIGIVARDFGMQKPRNAELARVAVDKLEQLYPDNGLETERAAETTTFAGEKAQRLRFKGHPNWWGDCYMFSHHGIAYWLIIATPDKEQLSQWADDLQHKEGMGFTLLSDRRGWREQPVPTETFESDSKALTLTAPKEVWDQHPAKDEEEKGDLFLTGKYKRDKDNRKAASVMVLALEPQTDPIVGMKKAQEYVEARKKTESPDYSLVSADDEPEAPVKEGKKDGDSLLGTMETLGNRRGRVAELKLLRAKSPMRYIQLAVVNAPDVSYAIRCECTWESREIWRQDFQDLLQTLNMRKKAEKEKSK